LSTARRRSKAGKKKRKKKKTKKANFWTRLPGPGRPQPLFPFFHSNAPTPREAPRQPGKHGAQAYGWRHNGIVSGGGSSTGSSAASASRDRPRRPRAPARFGPSSQTACGASSLQQREVADARLRGQLFFRTEPGAPRKVSDVRNPPPWNAPCWKISCAADVRCLIRRRKRDLSCSGGCFIAAPIARAPRCSRVQ